ncbi:tRNA 2-selenouridine(34) synthase MnmH [Crenobacter sp. SG2305]|uniref:tRNA 2-selenouridine(34) synthase MnmH n=1 Tax=Crenobacter oryzisoli TaxID=3056844 RepID=UPI0025AADF3F|nr:tRNA 2-selenouridine(34) synthase MnmH [Crenobacter sp. SG2305]MDN0082231.1 tRNA 2-selenouridine(34) synthase MnmH [Crenobacter sp. SG2305]
MLFKVANVAQRTQFDEIIDVRTPSEFAEDHLPGAINCPVLDDEERARVGTLYKQVSPFEARKVGAALVARNIARHIEERFHDRPKDWRPLIYCWRGGQRSGAATIILTQIGWKASQLEGGYKAYRHEVIEKLAKLPTALDLRMVCGPTGSGKSRLLAALLRTGHQVLDLEALARHRGSVLGKLPDEPQPAQKGFDSQLLTAIEALDPARPVFVESESKRIGFVSLPDALFARMHASPCLMVDVPMAERVRFLCEDYDFYLQDPESLVRQLGFLKGVYANRDLEAWYAMAREGHFAQLVEELLVRHYDPLYFRSMNQHYPQLADAPRLKLASLTPEALDAAAADLPL